MSLMKSLLLERKQSMRFHANQEDNATCNLYQYSSLSHLQPHGRRGIKSQTGGHEVQITFPILLLSLARNREKILHLEINIRFIKILSIFSGFEIQKVSQEGLNHHRSHRSCHCIHTPHFHTNVRDPHTSSLTNYTWIFFF